jgi:hypothetical protein
MTHKHFLMLHNNICRIGLIETVVSPIPPYNKILLIQRPFVGVTSIAFDVIRFMTARTSLGWNLNRLRLNTPSYSASIGADMKTSQKGDRAA